MLFPAKWMQINESIKTSWSDYFPALWYLWFYFGQLACPGQYFMRGGGAGDNLLVSYELPRAGAALWCWGAWRRSSGQGRRAQCRGCRERERESGQSQYYNLLQSLRAQPAAHSSHCQPHSPQIAPVKASKSGGWEDLVTICSAQWWDLSPWNLCVYSHQTDRDCKPVKTRVKSVSIVCECWAKSKMATIETKIWIAINPKNIWMTASGQRPSCVSQHGGWPGWQFGWF